MTTIEIRKSNESDVTQIMDIISSAKRFLHENGVNQWQEAKYPSSDIISSDIATGGGWVAEIDGHLVGTMYLSFDGEPTYNHIYDGAWLTPEDAHYGVIHRLAVSDSARGRGVAKRLIHFAMYRAVESNIHSLRVDTHADNAVMQTLLRKIGFRCCGIIYLLSGDSRIAFELCL